MEKEATRLSGFFSLSFSFIFKFSAFYLGGFCFVFALTSPLKPLFL